MKKIFITIIAIASLLVTTILLYNSYTKSNNAPSSQKGEIERITSAAKPEAVETIASGLEIPWSLAFLPDGDILFSERPGRLNLLSDGKVSLISQIPEVKHYGEGGLMGITLHPDFINNNYVYLMYTYSGNGNNTLNRVVRYKYENGSLSDMKIIVDSIPGAIYHNGGRIKFGPDNFLYITTGDSRDSSLAQDKDSLAGKILKVNDEGDPAPGNPFNTRVYSYGHRNPQGITWDTSGKLYQTEHGRSLPTGYDELNIIEAGKNYGWPEIEGNETRPNMVTPIANSGLGTWAPGSAAFYENSIFFGGLKGEALYEFKLDNENPILIEHFKNQFGRIRDVIVGPDKMIYITTSNRDGRGNPLEEDDRIIRIDPSQL